MPGLLTSSCFSAILLSILGSASGVLRAGETQSLSAPLSPAGTGPTPLSTAGAGPSLLPLTSLSPSEAQTRKESRQVGDRVVTAVGLIWLPVLNLLSLGST